MDERRIQILRMDELQFRAFVDDQLRAGSVQFEQHRQLLEQNIQLAQQTADNTREMVELFGASKRGLSFLQTVGGFLNRTARWLMPILAVGGAIWALLHGQPPRGGE